MNIALVENNDSTRPLYIFFKGITDGLCVKIYSKLHTYIQHGDIYHCKSLKSLNSKIWKYKGTIYKLRVDNGKESARVLFSKSTNSNLIIIHAFIKSTQKTPKKDARQAIAIYQSLDHLKTVNWNDPSRPC